MPPTDVRSARFIAAAEGGLWGVTASALLALVAIATNLAALGLIVVVPVLVISGAALMWRASRTEAVRGVRRLIIASAAAATGIVMVMVMVQPGEECRDLGGSATTGRIECEPRE